MKMSLIRVKKDFANGNKKLLQKLVIASVLSTGLTIIPTSPAYSAAPVGSGTLGTDTNRTSFISSAAVANGVRGGNLAFALGNAEATAGAVMAVTNSATQTARSLGLVAANTDSASGLGLTQTATVALGGVLSFYSLTATSLSITWTGGTVTASATASTNLVGNAISDTATAFAFTTAAAASGVAHIASILWTAPTTAGTYVIDSYVTTGVGGTGSFTATNPVTGGTKDH
jgi:hypothetical protein